MHHGIIGHRLRHCDGTPPEAKRGLALVSAVQEKERERKMVVGARDPASEAGLVSAFEEKTQRRIGGFSGLGHCVHKPEYFQ